MRNNVIPTGEKRDLIEGKRGILIEKPVATIYPGDGAPGIIVTTERQAAKILHNRTAKKTGSPTPN